MVTHVHGGNSISTADGDPEEFFSPDFAIQGPLWRSKIYPYENTQEAGALWYHDHALGITRANVNAGMAGFYIVRDQYDTGKPGNLLDLPVYPYETGLVIQDRMFKKNGELFYPAFPGDPTYEDFITGEGAVLPGDLFPGGGPTALAEFFGDVMVVNGKIWPKMEVEPRNYRMRVLNGCDSRYLVLQLFEVQYEATDFDTAGDPIPFTVIGNDQGLASSPRSMDSLLVEPGARVDIVVDFSTFASHSRLIMKNTGGDEPFGGDIPGPVAFDFTDRVMAFDVVKPLNTLVSDNFSHSSDLVDSLWRGKSVDRTRKVGLFEGLDQFGRLQPLLGTVEPATDFMGNPIYWPDTGHNQAAGLAGLQMEGTVAWHSPTTENPQLGDTEEWEIWNLSGDAHPIHLHLVKFEVVSRNEVVWDSATTDGDRLLDPYGFETASPARDGTYLVAQPLVQHDGAIGEGFKVVDPVMGASVDTPPEYYEDGLNDCVVALPGQVTTIRATFNRPGSYVWHCHILSHEDHEMMRRVYVGQEPVEGGLSELIYNGECTEASPCGECRGDCDSDSDCEDGLVCKQRRDYEYVPGCHGGGIRGKDYCYIPEAEDHEGDDDLALRYAGECTEERPCGRCDGDCDYDSDCEDGLICFQRQGTEEVPGCSGGGVPAKDYCFFESRISKSESRLDTPLAYIEECTAHSQCGVCEGDCDYDSDCEGDLVCFQRDGAQEVPGCSGTGVFAKDYCYYSSYE